MSHLLLRDDVFNHSAAINSLVNESNPVLSSIQQNVINANNKNAKKSDMEDFEKYLFSDERLDAASPDLWPETIPGITDFLARSSSPVTSELFPSDPFVSEKLETPEWLRDLDQDDINMLQGFGSLTTVALLDRVKELQDLSFQLGLEESREMTRGRFLGVLSSENNPSPSTSAPQSNNE